MTTRTKEYLMKLVRRDVEHAVDAIRRAEMQRERMPYDHDNNNSLDQYKAWRNEAMAAFKELERQ